MAAAIQCPHCHGTGNYYDSVDDTYSDHIHCDACEGRGWLPPDDDDDVVEDGDPDDIFHDEPNEELDPGPDIDTFRD